MLEKAGIRRADAFAAVSSGDNSNIIAARVARETFGIQQVVARIYDPGRAEVYQRLGITTVATVKWTADQVLRRILPAGAEPDFRDPSGTIRVDHIPVPEAWVGNRTVEFQMQSRSRIAWIDRLGEGMLPDPRDGAPGGRHAPHRDPRGERRPRLRRARGRPRRRLRQARSTADMRVAIAGAGAVGRSIARELIENGHQVLLIDKNPSSIRPERVPNAEWLLADSCELSSLAEAQLGKCDVVIAATGDDKANLVTSLLAKTEFGVPRTVGRVNHPNNEWLFTEAWGVDVNVSTPRIMSALVEEAVSIGDLVRLFTFRQGNANLVEMTLSADSPYVGTPAGLVPFPDNCALVTILRDGQVYTPERRAAAGVRRRAAVRRAGRGRDRARAPALPQPAPRLSPGPYAAQPSVRRARRPARPGVRLRESSQTIEPERGELQRPAERDLEHAEGRDGGVGVHRPGVAGQPDRRLDGHAQQARRDQQPGQPAAELHDLPVLVPRGRVAGDAADHEADQRPADQAGERQHHGVAAVVEDARAGSRPAPGPARSRRPRRSGARSTSRCRCRRAR